MAEVQALPVSVDLAATGALLWRTMQLVPGPELNPFGATDNLAQRTVMHICRLGGHWSSIGKPILAEGDVIVRRGHSKLVVHEETGFLDQIHRRFAAELCACSSMQTTRVEGVGNERIIISPPLTFGPCLEVHPVQGQYRR